MANKNTREELVVSISQMQDAVNDTDTPKNVKELIRPSLAKAQAQLKEMDAAHKELHAATKAETEAKTPALKKVRAAAKQKVVKKVADIEKKVKQKLTELQKLVKSKPSLKDKYGSTGAGSLEKDAQRRAKKPGRRVSKVTGNVYVETRANRSDVLGNKKYPMLKDGGLVEKYKNKGGHKDKDTPAKKPGWRYTAAGARRLGVHEDKVPTTDHIQKHQGQYFHEDGKSHRYLYQERRANRSDRAFLENGGTAGGPVGDDPLSRIAGDPTYDFRFNKENFAEGGPVSSYFGAGQNLEVFGYHTAHFDICPKATEQFTNAIGVLTLEMDPEDSMYHSMTQALADCAKKVDQILGDAKAIFEPGYVPNPFIVSPTVAASNLAAIYNYKSGSHIDLAEVLTPAIDFVIGTGLTRGSQDAISGISKMEIGGEVGWHGAEVRNSTTSEYAIFFEGKELRTTKSGAINSMGGIVLTATLPTGEPIKWRSNDVYGRKGFSFDREIFSAKDDNEKNGLPREIREKLEYKITNDGEVAKKCCIIRVPENGKNKGKKIIFANCDSVQQAISMINNQTFKYHPVNEGEGINFTSHTENSLYYIIAGNHQPDATGGMLKSGGEVAKKN